MSYTPTLAEDTPPASPSSRQAQPEDVCCVCLEPLRPGARGAHRAVLIPTCNRHVMHLGCMAQWRVEDATGQHLQCPLCQNGHPSSGAEGRWLPEHDEQLAALCTTENVPPPRRRGGAETAQIQVRDYAVRTFTRQDAPEPPAPIHITVSCCPRVAALRDGHNQVSFVDLPGREVPFSPIARRGDAGITHWDAAWSCARCGTITLLDDIAVPVQAGSACATCGRLLHWHWDVTRQQGHLTCHCPPGAQEIVEVITSEEDVPLTPAPPPPQPETDPPAGPPNPPTRNNHSGWYDRGPPNGQVRTDRNSWCYVPLLLGAAGLLHPIAAAQWRADPRSHAWWDNACRRLQQAQPVPADTIVEAIWIAVGEREPLLLQRLRDAARDHPPPALADLAWCLRHCTHDDGYIPAPVQEICLQVYGGLTMSSELDRVTNAYRAAPEAEPQPTPLQSRRHGNPEPDSGQERLPATPPIACPLAISRQAWESLDTISLQEEFTRPAAALQAVPRFLVEPVKKALKLALRGIVEPNPAAAITTERAWKLLLLLPRMLLCRPAQTGAIGKRTMQQRATTFAAGQWQQLLASVRSPETGRCRDASNPEASAERAAAQVRRGELSRARQTLTSSPLAPGTDATLEILQDQTRRPAALRTPLPANLEDYQPHTPLQFNSQEVAEAIRTAKRGSAPGLSGATAEHYKVLLDDEEGLSLFTATIELLAQGRVPEDIMESLSTARLTALSKPNGGVRGIATGEVLRRLTSRVLARQYAEIFDTATRPFQYALRTRAGTDCLAAILRTASELDASATIVSLDGRAAYDTVSRAAMFHKLLEVAPALVPFVRGIYGRTSRYYWWNDAGERKEILQAEGCHQGDPLAPALYALAQHQALESASRQLEPGECLAAYLDDIYIVVPPHRARPAYDVVAAELQRHAGVAPNPTKTRAYNGQGGPAPEGIRELGPDVWRGHRPLHEQGLLTLGTPIGSPAFVAHATAERLQDEQHLLDQLHRLPDLQSAWLLLLHCCAPRAQHILRTVPPDQSAAYAERHDSAVWNTLWALLGEAARSQTAADDQAALARSIGQLPGTLGGVGLTSAVRLAPAAYWAAWADALPVMTARRPDAAERCVAELRAGPAARAPSLRAANAAADQLRAAGWATIPAWEDLQATRAPPSNGRPEPGTGCPGWQQPATRALHIHYRESQLLPHLTPQCQALLRSQSGPHAAAWLTAVPTEPALTISSDHFHTALRRRLRLPLALADHRCGGDGSAGCGAVVDPYGDHRAACARSGHLARRAPLIEQAWVRVCREALGGEGRVVPQQWLARTTAPGVREDDRRRLDLVVYGATCNGTALCCDVTLVSPLRADGNPHPRTARENGAALLRARRRKWERYPELLRPGPQRLIVLACELGGRWAAECGALIRDLLRVRAPRAPTALRHASRAGWERRWWGMLSCAQQTAVASTLLGNVWRSPTQPWGDTGPPLSDVLQLADPEEPSRLPLRS